LSVGRRWHHLINLSGADLSLQTPLELQHYLFPLINTNIIWGNYFDAINTTLLASHIEQQSFVTCYRDHKVIKLPYIKQQRAWFMPIKGQLWMTLARSERKQFALLLFVQA
jgi:hypothetical protein